MAPSQASSSANSDLGMPQRRRRRRALVDDLNPDYKWSDEAEEAIQKQAKKAVAPGVQPKREFDFPYSQVGSLWSDKTMLSVAVAKAMTKSGGVDMLSVSEEHVLALGDAVLEGNSESWPSTTRISIQSIALSNTLTESEARERDFLSLRGIEPPSASSITYFTSGNEASLSDGFLPKLSIVSLYYATRSLGVATWFGVRESAFDSDDHSSPNHNSSSPNHNSSSTNHNSSSPNPRIPSKYYSRDRKWWELQRIIGITHTHPLAVVCGITWSTFFERLARLEDLSEIEDYVFRQLLLMELFSLASELENDYGESDGHLSKCLSWIISNVDHLEVDSLASKIRHSNRQCLSSLLWTLGLFLLEGISPRLVQLTRQYTIDAVPIEDQKQGLNGNGILSPINAPGFDSFDMNPSHVSAISSAARFSAATGSTRVGNNAFSSETQNLLLPASDARLSLVTSLIGLAIGTRIFPKPWTEHMWQLNELLETARGFTNLLNGSLPNDTQEDSQGQEVESQAEAVVKVDGEAQEVKDLSLDLAANSSLTTPPHAPSITLPSSFRPITHHPRPIDVEPAIPLEFTEDDQYRLWAAPYRPNGPLIAQALLHTSISSVLASVPGRIWQASGISRFLTWITHPSLLSASTLLITINSLALFAASIFIGHGRAITAPEPPKHEYHLHERFYPVLMPHTPILPPKTN